MAYIRRNDDYLSEIPNYVTTVSLVVSEISIYPLFFPALLRRHRRAELEQKSRQLLEERDQLSATFEAARQRTTELNQPPQVSMLTPDKRLSVVSMGSDLERGEKGR